MAYVPINGPLNFRKKAKNLTDSLIGGRKGKGVNVFNQLPTLLALITPVLIGVVVLIWACVKRTGVKRASNVVSKSKNDIIFSS